MIVSALASNPISTAAYFLLMAAIASLWITPRQSTPWISFASGATFAALIAGKLTTTGLGGIALLGIICFAFYRPSLKSIQRVILGLFVFILSLVIGTHKFPGFKNWLIMPNLTLSPDSFPIQLYLNFDKPLIGLFLTGFGVTRIKTLREWKALLKTTLPILFFASLTLLGLSVAIGYVRLDLKWFEFSWLWLLVNLLFTCVAEEAFFRGFLQTQLARITHSWQHTASISWIITSILFGLAHLSGGWTYACLSTVAGLFYGYAYLKTQKVEASILVHFAVNAIHFLAFTYPALREMVGAH